MAADAAALERARDTVRDVDAKLVAELVRLGMSQGEAAAAVAGVLKGLERLAQG